MLSHPLSFLGSDTSYDRNIWERLVKQRTKCIMSHFFLLPDNIQSFDPCVCQETFYCGLKWRRCTHWENDQRRRFPQFKTSGKVLLYRRYFWYWWHWQYLVRPDRTGPDRTGPDQTRPDQTRVAKAFYFSRASTSLLRPFPELVFLLYISTDSPESPYLF